MVPNSVSYCRAEPSCGSYGKPLPVKPRRELFSRHARVNIPRIAVGVVAGRNCMPARGQVGVPFYGCPYIHMCHLSGNASK